MEIKTAIGHKECSACLDFCCKFEESGRNEAPVFLEHEYKTIKKIKARGLRFKPFGKTGAWQVVLLKTGKNEYHCPFFERNSRLCLIEKNKPFDCRFFPFIFMKNKKGSSIYIACFKENVCFGLEMLSKEKFKMYIDYLKKVFSSEKGSLFAKNYIQVLNYDPDAKLIFKIK